jgi:hypothetical protein
VYAPLIHPDMGVAERQSSILRAAGVENVAIIPCGPTSSRGATNMSVAEVVAMAVWGACGIQELV